LNVVLLQFGKKVLMNFTSYTVLPVDESDEKQWQFFPTENTADTSHHVASLHTGLTLIIHWAGRRGR